jgi:hypothetical protein
MSKKENYKKYKKYLEFVLSTYGDSKRVVSTNCGKKRNCGDYIDTVSGEYYFDRGAAIDLYTKFKKSGNVPSWFC